MIQIYSAGNENFQKNGDAVLMCYSCLLTAELNGTWHIDLTVPIDKEGRWKLVTEEAVLKVRTWQDDEQLYRIESIKKSNNGVSAVAYPIFYDSANDAFLLDCRPTNKTGQQALDIMCSGTPYSGRSNITPINTAYFVRRNLLNAIMGNESPTFIERWGGEVLFDNYTVIINDHVGGDYGVEARYGRNLKGVSYVVDTSELVTRIVPIAYNGHMLSGSAPWVDSSHINSYAKVYTKEITYENIRMAEDVQGDDDGIIVCHNQAELQAALIAAAQEEFATGIDTPKVTMDFDMALIQHMAQSYTEKLQDSDGVDIQDSENLQILSVWYRDYASLEVVRLGDTIHCRDSRLDISSTARVISLVWDCVREKVTHVTLGDYKEDFAKEVTKMVSRSKNIFNKDGSLIAEQVKGFLDASRTQLRAQYNIATRQDVLAILFENLDEDSPMYGALGIGTQGISISKTRTSDGRDWEWTTGITANGMNASMGVFGILSDQLGRNWINLDTGEISLGGSTTIGGKTMNTYMGEAHAELAAYEASNDAVIADIQAQLDGAIETYFYDYTPTLNNYPANEWTTEALKEQHQGDMFYDKSTGNSYRFFKDDATGTWAWNLITDSVATQALAMASAAKDTADGKRRVFVSQPVVPYDTGDLWYNGSGILVCTTAKTSSQSYAAADWTAMTAYATAQEFNDFLTDYALDMSGLEAEIDDRIQTYSQTTDPSTGWSAAEKPKHAGDLWYNLNDGKTYRYSGSAWSEVTTTPPSSVLTAINDKATIFTTQPTPPYSVGDLWFNSSNSDIMTCITARASGNYTASDWEKRNKYTDDSALNAYKAEMEMITGDLQNQIDGKIQTWRQASDPSVAWTQQDDGPLQDQTGADILDETSSQILTTREIEKLLHAGDLWQNISNNTEWRWTGSEWEEMAVPDALVDKVDGKRTIYSSQPVPPYEERDLWCEGENGDIKICTHSRASGESFSASDWTLASKYTDDSGLLDFISGDYAETISALQEQTDGKAETWYQSTDPSTEWTDPETKALHEGDLWYKTTDSTTWYYTGSAWTQMDIPQDVFDTIDSKAQIFATQPTGPYYKNDLWYTGTVVKVCIRDRATGFSAADWEKKDYYTDDTELQNFIQDTYTPAITSMQNELDGKIETWHQSSDPSIHWTRKETDVVLQDHTGADLLDSSGQQILTDRNIEKYEHTGDIWKDTTDNTEYMYSGDGWIVMDAPDELYDLVDGKSSVFTTQSTPTGAQERDLWFRGPDYPIYTFLGGAWVEYNKYTSDENLDEFVDATFTPWKQEKDRQVQTVFQMLDGEIIAAVIDGDIINAINISSEGIAIEATKLNINGVTSINNGFKVKTDGSFEANSGSIGNIHVTQNSIYSGSHSAYNSNSQGFYLGSDGKFGIGDSSNYMRWDGSSLSLNVGSLSIGGKAASTKEYAEGQAEDAKNAAIGEAEKYCTSYLYYSVNTGLVMASDAQNYSSGYNTRLTSEGIKFYNGTTVLGELSGTDLRFYNGGKLRMLLDAGGISFYKTDTNTAAAEVTTNGFILGSGTIAGFTFESNSIYNGTLGSADSVYVSPGSPGSADIAGSGSISGWAFAAGTGFGVTKAGKLYANSGKINGINIGGQGIYSGSKTNYNTNLSGFCLETNGNFGIGDANSHVYYWVSDNTSHLEIKADTLTIGGSDAATKGYAEEKADEAANTAKSYLYWHRDTGLVVSPNGTSYSSGYNTRVQSDGIRFYNGNTLLSEMTGSELKFYYSGDVRMELSSTALKFYKPNTSTVAASIESGGLSVKSGSIANFTIDSAKLYCNNFEIIPDGTSKIINGTSRSNIVLYSNGNFGVSTSGDLYAYSGTIGGWTINGTSMTATNIKLDSSLTDSVSRISFGSTWQYYISGNGNAALNGIAGESIGAHYNLGSTGFYADQYGLECNTQSQFNGSVTFSSGVYVDALTSGSGSTVVMGNAHRLYYTSSSKRYKDIDRKLTEADIAKAYDINTYRAKYKDSILDKDDQMNGVYMPMLIAEEVAEAVPEAAIIRNGKVEDWNHRVLIPVMFQMLKSQKKEIEKLRSLINQKGIA